MHILHRFKTDSKAFSLRASLRLALYQYILSQIKKSKMDRSENRREHRTEITADHELLTIATWFISFVASSIQHDKNFSVSKDVRYAYRIYRIFYVKHISSPQRFLNENCWSALCILQVMFKIFFCNLNIV